MNRTLRAGVTGWPVAHSLSPLIHGAWIQALGLDAAYERFAIEPDHFAGFVAEHRGGATLRGVNVTIPHKEAALAAADRADAVATSAGAANVLLFHKDGAIEARNTDGIGVIEAFRAQAPGVDLSSVPVLIIGAGGAARGAVAALAAAGNRDIRIVNRTPAKAQDLAARFAGSARGFGDSDLPDQTTGVGAVINATSLGLGGGPGPAVDWRRAAPGAVAMDMVYTPLRTVFLTTAAAAGNPTVDGLEMLIGQAVPSFQAFYGVAPPLSVDVRALCLAALEARQ